MSAIKCNFWLSGQFIGIRILIASLINKRIQHIAHTGFTNKLDSSGSHCVCVPCRVYWTWECGFSAVTIKRNKSNTTTACTQTTLNMIRSFLVQFGVLNAHSIRSMLSLLAIFREKGESLEYGTIRQSHRCAARARAFNMTHLCWFLYNVCARTNDGGNGDNDFRRHVNFFLFFFSLTRE